ncbi:MAG: hypothetical protein ACRDT2_04905 [Natronosporangium sp.]
MFRVPSDPAVPTFDETTKVGFFRWLTSSGPERKEWARRRNAAARTAQVNQLRRFDAWADEKIAEGERQAQAKRRKQGQG